MAEVALRAVAKRYGRVEVIQGMDLDIRHGEFTVFVGPSGCGKSTLLRMVAGLEPISDGEVRIAGRRVNELPPRQRDIAMVFQDYALYPHKTLFENMAFGLRLRKTAEDEIQRRVMNAARLLRIDHMLDRRPAALSGGQRQRVAIGRAIVREPQVFLFDEPLSNLDAQLRNEMRSEIKRLHQRLGATIIYVTHDQVEAMTLADRIAVLSAGRLMQYDTPDAIYNRPAALFVAGFTGAPPMNLADCTLAGNDADLGGLVLALPAALAGRARGRAALKLGVRPENLLPTAPAGTALRQRAQVSLLEPLGSETLVTLRLGRAEMVARWPAAFRAAPGTAVDVYVDPQHLHLFDAASGAAV
jgi:multiple sugar transport system ATP-binding protein